MKKRSEESMRRRRTDDYTDEEQIKADARRVAERGTERRTETLYSNMAKLRVLLGFAMEGNGPCR